MSLHLVELPSIRHSANGPHGYKGNAFLAVGFNSEKYGLNHPAERLNINISETTHPVFFRCSKILQKSEGSSDGQDTEPSTEGAIGGPARGTQTGRLISQALPWTGLASWMMGKCSSKRLQMGKSCGRIFGKLRKQRPPPVSRPRLWANKPKN